MTDTTGKLSASFLNVSEALRGIMLIVTSTPNQPTIAKSSLKSHTIRDTQTAKTAVDKHQIGLKQ